MVDKILQELEAKGYCYMENLLNSEELRDLNVFIETHKSEFEAAKVGGKGNRQRIESVRGDYTFWLDPLKPEKPFDHIMSFLRDLKEKINAQFYLGLKEYECHLAYYPSGTFYQKHLDRFETDSSRRVSFVFYLNEDWKSSLGGELVMYDKKGNILETFFPLPGAFACFLSDEFPHEVKSSLKERRSLTGWMHNKIIN